VWRDASGERSPATVWRMLIGGVVVGLALALTPVERTDRFEGALTGTASNRIAQLDAELADIALRRPTLTSGFVMLSLGGSVVVAAAIVIPVTLVGFLTGSGAVVVVLAGFVGGIGLLVAIIGLAITLTTLSDQGLIDERAAKLKEERDRLGGPQTMPLMPLVPLASF
jgi:hypothetical protein